MLKPLVHQARIAFGTLFGLHIDQSAIGDQTMVELELNLNPEVGTSLPMYYAFYYQPFFRRSGPQKRDPDIFSSTKMNEWIQKIRLTSDDPRESSPEARAFFDLARNGNELVWAMTTVVAGLSACLNREAAILVLSTAFSVSYDPRCVLPAHGSWSCPQFPISCDTNAPYTDLPSQVRRFFEKGSQKIKLKRPRYGLDCTIGKRLKEDFVLMSHLADNCGLQEEMTKNFESSSSIFELSSKRDKADLTLALVALTSQTLPWTMQGIEGGDPYSLHRVIFVCSHGRSVMQVHTSATTVLKFLYAIRHSGTGG